jgi:hypothetical protein
MTPLPYSRQQDLPRRYTGRPLSREEQHLLHYVRSRQAIEVMSSSPQLAYLLATGLLLHIPSLYGPVLILGLAGRHVCGLHTGVISDDLAADLLYFNLAKGELWEQGYRLIRSQTTTRAIVQRGHQRAVMLAKLSCGGYSRVSVAQILKLASSNAEDVIVVTTAAAVYARLAGHHRHLRVYALALPVPPTRACNTS